MPFDNLGRLAESGSSSDAHDAARLRLVNNYLDSPEQHKRPVEPPPTQPIPEKTWPTESDALAGVFDYVINASKDPSLASKENVNIFNTLDKLFVDRLRQTGGNAAPVEHWANEELATAGSPYRMKFGDMYHRNDGWDTRLVQITDKDGKDLQHRAIWTEYYNPQYR